MPHPGRQGVTVEMASRDYYEVLGVSRGASREDIKKAYKRLAKEHHPDRNGGDEKAENRFKEISEAYHTLSDPKKREQYDAFGGSAHRGDRGFGGGRPGAGGSQYYTWSSGPGQSGFDFKDIFSQMFGGGGRPGGHREARGAGEPFSFDAGASPFGFDFSAGGPAAGRDVEAEITIAFEDAVRGGTHRLSLRREGACPTCNGSGNDPGGPSTVCASCGGSGRKQVVNAGPSFAVTCDACAGNGRVYTQPCRACRGSGAATGTDTISVKIPPGVVDGGRLRIPGKGERGPDGRQGDLYLRVRVTPHRYFRREGDHIHLDLPVTVGEAALGARVRVPTLDGTSTLRIPAGTQGGATLRMKGKGVPNPKGKGRGDQFVHLQISLPKNPDERTRRLLEELRKLEDDPREGRF